MRPAVLLRFTMITSSNIKFENISFVKVPMKGYDRYDVKYDGHLAMITTNSPSVTIKSFGIQDEISNFQRTSPQKQATFIIDESNVDQCEFYNVLHTIAEKFAKSHPKLELHTPFKSIDEGARMYCRLIQSAAGKIYTRAYTFDNKPVEITTLDTMFTGRPLVCISFTVKDRINMRIQVSELCVQERVESFRLSRE